MVSVILQIKHYFTALLLNFELHSRSSHFCFPSVPPEFLVPLSDVTCDNGESVTLRCKVCGRPRATVTWRGPNQSNLANNGHFSIAYR